MSAVVVVGSCNLDLIVEVESLPASGETVLGGDVISRPGGKGANQAVAARRLGAETMFVGATGADQFGATLRAALAAEDVDLTHLMTTDSPSGVALVIVDSSATNLITVAVGANRRLTPEHVSVLRGSLAPTSVLLLQLEIPLATCLAAARIAHEAGAPVLLNAAPLPSRTDGEFEQLLALTDVLIVNEAEAMGLHDVARPSDIEEWRSFASEVSVFGPPAVVVTLGDAGAVVAERERSFAVAPYQVNAVDTTGAGDAFCGAVAASLAEKRTLDDAVHRGCAAGALATTALGAQSALPTADEVDRLQATGRGR
jgi:ribokinase